MKKVLALTLAMLLCLGVLAGCGEDAGSDSSKYPTMAITINTSKSGSAVDFGARAFAKILGDKLGNNVIVNSCAGQSEAIREVLNAEPDGYSLGFTNNTVIINDVAGAVDFDSIEDVEIVGVMAMGVSSWIGMRAAQAEELGIETFEDLIAYSQAHSEELSIGSNPNSSTEACVNLLIDAGLDVLPVASGLVDERLTDVLAGVTDIYVGNYGELEQYVQTGEMVCLVSCSRERSSFSPDVPCTFELGYEVEFPVYYYITAPKGTPEEVMNVINEAMAEISEDEGYISDLIGNSNEPYYLNHEEATEYLAAQKQALIDMGMTGE